MLSGSHPVGEFIMETTAPTHDVDGDSSQSDTADQTTENVHRQQVLLTDPATERFLQPASVSMSINQSINR